MKHTKDMLIIISIILSMVIALGSMLCAFLWVSLNFFDGSSAGNIPSQEKAVRLELVSTAMQHLGLLEGSDDHSQLIQIYNSHEPLAQGYEVKVSDNWCATFASCAAIECGMTDIIPTECSCERQIGLWKDLGRWTEQDDRLPLPGDYIYYNWDAAWDLKDNTGWADHVGIVVGTAGPAIKVIEGNKDDMVTYRIIFRWDHRIRGYGLPDYGSIA